MAAKETLSPAAKRLEEFMERKEIASAPAWRPNPGDTLIGTVIGHRVGSTEKWGEYPIVIYKTEDGFLAFHAFHTMARELLEGINSAKGQTHMLCYEGERVTNASKGTEEEVNYHYYYGENYNTPPEDNGK